MRAALLAAAVMGLACGGVAGQEKKGTAKADTKYLSVKELDAKAKDTLELVKRREAGYVDKGILAFADVIQKADPKSAAARHIAGQAAFFMGKLYYIKVKTAATDEEREKLLLDRMRWVNAAPLPGADRSALGSAWEAIERQWSLEDLKK